MGASNILWGYAVLLVAGGVMGFVKAKSRASLIASVISSVPILLAALGIVPVLVGEIAIGLLFAMFVVRYARSRKPVPALPMIGLSAVALVLLRTVAK